MNTGPLNIDRKNTIVSFTLDEPPEENDIVLWVCTRLHVRVYFEVEDDGYS